MNSRLLLAFLILIPALAVAQTTHKGLNFQGHISDSSGNPLNLSNITVNVKVLSPNDCILMEEEHSPINISNGFLNVVVGKGTRTADDKSYTFKQIFSNSAVLSGLDPVSGAAGSCTFTPNGNGQDSRKVKVYFLNGSDPVDAEFNVRASAFAVHSEDSGLLQGKAANQFVQTSTDVTQAKADALFNSSIYNNLLNLSSSSTGALSLPSGNSAQQPASPLPGMLRFNSQSSQLEFYNGTTWTSASGGGGGGGVTSLNSQTGASQTLAIGSSGTDVGINSSGNTHTFNIPSASGSNRGVLTSSDWNAFNNKMNTNQSFSGDVSGMATNLSVNKIKGGNISLSSLVSGNYLRYNGSAWVNGWISSWDVTAGLGYAPLSQSGGTMTGTLDMGGQMISNVSSLYVDSTFMLRSSNGGALSLSVPTAMNSGDSYSLKLPRNAGSAGQVLATDASGNLTWTANGGTLVTGTSGTNFNISTSGGTSTFNLPSASAGTRGLLISSDWTAFNNKMNTNQAHGGDVSGVAVNLSVNKIKGETLSNSSSSSGQVLRFNGFAWVNSALSNSDLSSLLPSQSGNSGKVLTTNGILASWGSGVPNDTLAQYKVRAMAATAVTLSGTQMIDGVSLAVGDRVLVRDGTANAGVYIVQSGAWTRAPDMDDGLEAYRYKVLVQEGLFWKGSEFISASTSHVVTLGSTALDWSMIGSSLGANENVGFGRKSFSKGTTGLRNTAFGNFALSSVDTGSYNLALGTNALAATTQGGYNVAAGVDALSANVNGGSNVAIGFNSLKSNVGKNQSTAVGYAAMMYADDTSSSGPTYNTAVGYRSLAGSTTASANTGTMNTALGHSALQSVTSGSMNIGLGYSAGSAITTGSGNVVIGSAWGTDIATSSNNILIADGQGTERIRVDSSGNVGLGTSTPGARLDVNGRAKFRSGQNVAVRVVNATGAITVATTDYIICVRKTASEATTVNLPASPSVGDTYVIKDCKGDANSNNVTIVPASGNINGSASYILNTARSSVTFFYGFFPLHCIRQ